MLVEGKLKRVALIAAVDISLKRISKSPERCARNLLELGLNAYPDRLLKKDQNDFFNQLLKLCKNEEIQEARDLFLSTFCR